MFHFQQPRWGRQGRTREGARLLSQRRNKDNFNDDDGKLLFPLTAITDYKGGLFPIRRGQRADFLGPRLVSGDDSVY